MKQVEEYIVPRSRVAQTHRAMRDKILAALEPLIFEAPSSSKVQRELEEHFAAKVQQRFACGVHSGTMALYLALRGCGIEPGDEVITVGNSDISTTAAISHCGAIPVLCDILESDYTIDPDLVEPLLTKRTKAILPVDLYGHPADLWRLREIADRHGLMIVEDAALAIGATDHGRPVGALADATVFSFAPYKPLGCVGNGAMVTTNDVAIARRIRLLRGYGHETEVAVLPGHQAHVEEGFNVPLDPLQAALLSVKLPFLDYWTSRRREIAVAYRHALAGLDVRMPTFRAEANPTFRSFTVRVANQRAVYDGLRQAGVEAVLHYTPPIYRQPVYPNGLPGSERLPVTERLAGEIVCLPVTPELTDDDVTYVASALRDILKADGHDL